MNQTLFRFAAGARGIGLTLSLILIVSNGLVLAARHIEVKVEIQSTASVSDGQNGALVEWRSSFEIGNLGYNVYRLQNGERVQINPSLIPGSVFNAGQDQPLYGKSYSFFDEKGLPGSEYEIEAVTVDNEHQSVTVKTHYDAKTLVRRAGSAAKNSEEFLSSKATQKLFGQRENPATIKIKDGVLSAEPRIQADSVQQRWVAAQPGLKFAIKTNGLYRVSRQQLADAGFDTNIPTINWQLYTDGVEQTMLLTGDNNGGVLGANGYLEFYGFGVDKLYTDTQVFYLVVGTAPGKRMLNSIGRKNLRVLAPSFQTVAQCRTSVAAQCNRPTTFTSDIINGAAENFFGDVIYNSPVNITINTPFVDATAAQAIIDVSIQGFSFNPPTHNFEVLLNGTVIGTVSGSGQNVMRASFTVPAALLQEGANVVRLNSTVFNSVTLLEYVRIHYARRFVTANDRLLFTTAYYRTTQIDGFTDASVRVFDVSDQNNVKVVNSIVTNNGATFTASVPATLQRLMYAVTDGAVLTPAAITANIPSNVYDTAQNKDLIIVTYKDWQTQADALAVYRQNQGLSVAVVNVEDIFDEFSFGAPTPAALRDFFARALPRYALLFGDATQDPRNYQSSTVNYVPTALIDTNYGEIASDEVLGDFAIAPGNQLCAVSAGGDCVSEFPIGRLSVRSAAQAQTQIDKIISFEQTVTAGETFSRGVLFVNDYVNGYNFAATNQALAARLPLNTPIQITGAVANPSSAQLAQTRAEIVSRINDGPFIVGYAGHGSNTGWSFPDIFPTASSQSLTNANKLSIFLTLTCLNGAFADFQRDPSLAESLMRNPNGGAAAVWASSGLTVAPGQDIMANDFYDLHRQASVGTRIGDLTKEAKLETTDNDVR
ncbi:MAG: C25 family cysteine peptidase, partial [Pyrinomonadaceae bacterium]